MHLDETHGGKILHREVRVGWKGGGASVSPQQSWQRPRPLGFPSQKGPEGPPGAPPALPQPRVAPLDSFRALGGRAGGSGRPYPRPPSRPVLPSLHSLPLSASSPGPFLFRPAHGGSRPRLVHEPARGVPQEAGRGGL